MPRGNFEKLNYQIKKMRTYKGNPFDQPENLPCDMGGVSGCFSSREYNMLRNNKGKQKAYVKGWEAAENGFSKKDCPYQPKIKHLIPTDPYFKAWHSGYESFLNNR